MICTGLLLWQIGPSALAGIAFFLLIIPIQVRRASSPHPVSAILD